MWPAMTMLSPSCFGLLAVLFGVVHADERADTRLRQSLESALWTLGPTGHVDDHPARSVLARAEEDHGAVALLGSIGVLRDLPQ